MKRQQAFKFKLRPNGQQQRELRRFAGACRFVFNRALALQKEHYEAGEAKASYSKLCGWLTERKQEKAWLKESPSQALQPSLKDLERAYQNFFAKRAAFPRFKKRGTQDSFRYPQGFKLDEENRRIFLPKLGWIGYRKSRVVRGTLKNVTVSYACGQWFVSIQTEYEVEQKPHPATSMVGVDVGIAKFATLSDSTVYMPINSYRTQQRRLARLQRQLSRQVKFSANWKEQKIRIQKLHHTIANVRKDYLHKTSTAISKNHAMIVIEDLQIKNLSKSAAGTLEQPGKRVSAKSGLNKSIVDQGWFEFRRQLEYKQLWQGGQVLAVPPQHTSQTCSSCGHRSKENRRSQSKFVCVVCGYAENADVNAAMNILAAGHAVLACGERVQSGRSMKQEPAEVI